MKRLLAWLGHYERLMVHVVWAIVSLVFLFGGMTISFYLLDEPEIAEEEGWPLARVTRVIDGDTIVVNWMGQEERIRILGIDAPETRRTRTFFAQAEELGISEEALLAYADIATQIVENWLLNRNVRLVFGGEEGEIVRDSFGRLLAYVELDGVDIGERLLRGGNAIVYEEADHPRLEDYRLYQEESRRARRGIWRNI